MSNSSDEGLKVTSHLLPFVDARTPVLVVSTGNEDSRIMRNEQPMLIQSKLAEEVYYWDAKGDLTNTSTGATAKVQTLMQLVEWFAKDPPENKKDGTSAAATAATPADPSAPPPINLEVGPKAKAVLITFDTLSMMVDSGKGHSSPAVTRTIKNAIKPLMANQRTLVLSGTHMAVPPELDGVCSTLEYPLPDMAYMRAVVRQGRKWFAPPAKKGDVAAWLPMTEDEEIEIATLLMGFKALEADNILARSFRRNSLLRRQDPETPMGFDLETIRTAKIEKIHNSGAMRIVLPQKRAAGEIGGSNLIGGAGGLKSWWNIRRRLFAEDARGDGIDIPRGAVIFGPGGTGKDWLVERLAEETGWTLIHLDLGALKSKWQGETHKNLREVFATAEAQAPCHLAISEFEKMFAGAISGGGNTAVDGTASEIYATFLNWMATRTKPIFVWGLANEIEHVPLPALRSGRFDRLFFMDLPQPWEREEIFSVHLHRTGWDPKENNINLALLAEKTENYTGAEIRAVVNEGIILKFVHEGPRKNVSLTTEHLLAAISEVPPSLNLKPAEVERMRKYATDGSLIRANSPEKTAAGAGGAPKKLGDKLRSK